MNIYSNIISKDIINQLNDTTEIISKCEIPELNKKIEKDQTIEVKEEETKEIKGKILKLKIKNEKEITEEIIFQNKSIIYFLDYYDKKFSEKVYNLEVGCLLEHIFLIGAKLYNPECMFIYFLVILGYYSYYYKKYLYFVKPLIHTLICLVFTLILKNIFNRKRPEANPKVKRRYNLRDREHNGSMPSGDSMQAANFAVCLICYFNNCIFGLFLIPLVMFSRMFYFFHYFLDTFVGMILGFILSTLTYQIINQFQTKFNFFL